MIRSMSVTALMVLLASAVAAQSYPSRPIRVVAGAPGGQGDRAARLIMQPLAETLGQPVIVDNRGSLAGDIVSMAAADGYTLLIDSISFWIAPLLQKTTYDPVKDFAPITMISSAPSVVVVSAASPINSIKDLISAARAKPDGLNYGSGGVGSSSHLAAELLNAMAGVRTVHVPYKGAAGALTALLGGEIQMTIASPGAVMANVKSGRLKMLAVTSAQPTVLAPGVPTVFASGVPGYEVTQAVALFAPAKTTTAVVSRISQDVARILTRADVKEQFFNSGAEVRGSTPGELAAAIKIDLAKWGKVIKDAGIRPE